MENITFKTIDGLTLSGLLWDRGSDTSALLLHMMPATKESWESFADELYSQKVNVLAFDFRGHGESEGIAYKKQTDQDIQKYFLDARSALNFLEEKYQHTNFLLAGASIGANISLQLMSQDHAIKKGIIISPGLDYHGVKAIDFVKDLSPSQSVLYLASYDDGASDSDNCGQAAEQLFNLTACKKTKNILKTGGHGTDLFDSHPDLPQVCLNFFLK